MLTIYFQVIILNLCLHVIKYEVFFFIFYNLIVTITSDLNLNFSHKENQIISLSHKVVRERYEFSNKVIHFFFLNEGNIITLLLLLFYSLFLS
jgi:hypothetical protein